MQLRKGICYYVVKSLCHFHNLFASLSSLSSHDVRWWLQTTILICCWNIYLFIYWGGSFFKHIKKWNMRISGLGEIKSSSVNELSSFTEKSADSARRSTTQLVLFRFSHVQPECKPRLYFKIFDNQKVGKKNPYRKLTCLDIWSSIDIKQHKTTLGTIHSGYLLSMMDATQSKEFISIHHMTQCLSVYEQTFDWCVKNRRGCGVWNKPCEDRFLWRMQRVNMSFHSHDIHKGKQDP